MNALPVFAVLACLILYILAGYPALLALRPRRPIRKSFVPRTVTVLMAVRNGAPWLDRKLANLTTLDYPRDLIDILIISDGSSDATESIAARWRDRGIELLVCPPEGKSAAINAGLARARGEIVLFTDVRQQLEPQSLRELVACFDDPSVGVVSGELFIRTGNSQEEESVGLYWKYEKWIRLRQSSIDSILGATGCIYAIRRALTVPIPKGILLDDVFLPLAAFFRGYRSIIDPAARAYDTPTSLQTEFRRKVRTQAGVYQLLRYYPQLLGRKNRMWLDFVSHKFARLMLPWILMALFAVSFLLSPPWRLAAAVQAGFYMLAALDLLIPDSWPTKRITALARTFVTLMFAAACAISILVVPAERLWSPAPEAANRLNDERKKSSHKPV